MDRTGRERQDKLFSRLVVGLGSACFDLGSSDCTNFVSLSLTLSTSLLSLACHLEWCFQLTKLYMPWSSQGVFHYSLNESQDLYYGIGDCNVWLSHTSLQLPALGLTNWLLCLEFFFCLLCFSLPAADSYCLPLSLHLMDCQSL